MAEPADPPNFEPPPLLSDCLTRRSPTRSPRPFHRTGRKPRHDGWTPGGGRRFPPASRRRRHRRACGARRRPAPPQSAYAFRNRRQGRAFAKMWDAMLIHRARARIASELQGRAIAGCVSMRKRDGDRRRRISLLRQPPRHGAADAGSTGLPSVRRRARRICALSPKISTTFAIASPRAAIPTPSSRRAGQRSRSPSRNPSRCRRIDDPELTLFAQPFGLRTTIATFIPTRSEIRDLDPTRQDRMGFRPVGALLPQRLRGLAPNRQAEETGLDAGPRRRRCATISAALASAANDPDGDASCRPSRKRRPGLTPPTSTPRTSGIGTRNSSSAPGAAASCSVCRPNSGTIWRRKRQRTERKNDRLLASLNFLNLFAARIAAKRRRHADPGSSAALAPLRGQVSLFARKDAKRRGSAQSDRRGGTKVTVPVQRVAL